MPGQFCANRVEIVAISPSEAPGARGNSQPITNMFAGHSEMPEFESARLVSVTYFPTFGPMVSLSMTRSTPSTSLPIVRALECAVSFGTVPLRVTT